LPPLRLDVLRLEEVLLPRDAVDRDDAPERVDEPLDRDAVDRVDPPDRDDEPLDAEDVDLPRAGDAFDPLEREDEPLERAAEVDLPRAEDDVERAGEVDLPRAEEEVERDDEPLERDEVDLPREDDVVDLASPAFERCLLTVRAAISLARFGVSPFSSSLSFTCLYWRSRFALHAFCGI
jgi:hypothetical protein